MLYLLSGAGGLQFSIFTGDKDAAELSPDSSISRNMVLPGWMVQSPFAELADDLLAALPIAGV